MEQKYLVEINKYLEELGKELDITKTEHENIVKSYEAVGKWLSEDTSSLNIYSPKILPQGSFMLGTIVRPINTADDIDIDLVCKLEKKPIHWTQKDLKKEVGDRLKSDAGYNRMLNEYRNGEYYKNGGRRCWTLKYSDSLGYHMDILPSFSDDNLVVLLEKTFSVGTDLSIDEIKKLSIRITDTEKDNFGTDSNIENWNKSNPFGYARWFFNKAVIGTTRMYSLKESVDPVRAYEKEKLPLQRVVQLLKRHRDIMFSSNEYNHDNRPISVIITTLATRAYDRSDNLIDAYTNIVRRMRLYIESRKNLVNGTIEKWVPNPINDEENFADKWIEVKEKEDYFYLWLDKLEEDLNRLFNNIGQGQNVLFESFSDMYGDKVSRKVFSNIAEKQNLLRENGTLKMAVGTGLLGSIGTKVQAHNFFGKE